MNKTAFNFKPLARIEIIRQTYDGDHGYMVDGKVVPRPKSPEPLLEMQKRYTTPQMKIWRDSVLKRARKEMIHQIKLLSEVKKEKQQVEEMLDEVVNIRQSYRDMNEEAK